MTCIGIVILALCVGIFVSQGYLVQAIQLNNNTSSYFLLFVSHAFYMFTMPVHLTFLKLFYKESIVANLKISIEHLRSTSKRQFILDLVLLTVVLNTGALLWYFSTTMLSISLVTVIYNLNCFFAYLFSIFYKIDELSRFKVLSIFFALLGTVLTSFVEDFGFKGVRGKVAIFYGLSASLASATFIGFYEVLFKIKLKQYNIETVLKISLLVTLIGLVTFLLMGLPYLFMLVKIPKFESTKHLSLILLNGVFGLAYNFGLMVVVYLTSPLFASIGIILSIPLTCVADYVFLNSLLNGLQIVGMFFVFAGFGMLILPEKYQPLFMARQDQVV